KTIGVNSSAQAFNVLDLAQACNIKFVNGKALLEQVRINKTHEELDNLRHAAKIADAAFADVISFIKPGMKEQEVSDFLHRHMENDGGYSCWSIVASGPNSSYPHYNEYERTIQKGDAVVLDFGCVYNGLCSDMSRTVFICEASERLRELYAYVNESNAAGEKAAREGATAASVDKAARDVLQKYGYAETLINRVGHGIGYMIHEAPDIKKCNPQLLEKGMCFSIEPGIYIAGDVGMRVEDIVVINEKGETEILNKSTHDLLVVGN
ncbi:MAG: M24 family metallopeptidase, partial [Oscillospiraceae bacterium]